MFRWLIVLSEVAILVLALQSTFAQYLLSDVQKQVEGWIESVATIPEKVELGRLNDAMSGHIETMRPFQQEYLSDVMRDKTRIRQFHKDYCKGDDKNPFIYGPSLQFFCSKIEESELLRI